jgi:tetratricopeptide (TPR) repeat protein
LALPTPEHDIAPGKLNSLLTHVAIVYAFMPVEFVHLPVVGASGAISGILGIFTIRFFHKRFLFGKFALPAAPILLVWLMVQGIMGILSLYHASYDLLDVTIQFRSVGYWSHFGGFVFGMLAASLTDMARQGQKEYLMDGARDALRRGTLLEVTRKFEWLLHYDPKDALAAAELGRTWALLGDKEQCVPCYRRAIELYLARGEVQQAADRYDEMRRFWPDAMFETDWHFRLACIFEEAGEHLRAGDAFGQVFCYRGECKEAEMSLLKSGHIQLAHLDRPELAAAILEKFIELYPESEWRSFAEETLARARWRTQERKAEGGDLAE